MEKAYRKNTEQTRAVKTREKARQREAEKSGGEITLYEKKVRRKPDEHPLTLGVLDPEKGPDTMISYLVKNRLISRDDHAINALAQAAKTKDEDFFLTERGSRLIDKANEEVYATIQERFGLETPEAAETFFQEQLTEANNQINELVDFFSLGTRLGLRTEIELASTPADMIYLLYSSNDPQTRYEAARQLSLATIAAEISEHRNAAEKRLVEVQKWLNRDVFDRNRIQDHTHYVIHDNETNEVQWEQGTDADISTVDQTTAHLKGFDQIQRPLQGKELGVVQLVRKKKGAIIKVFKRALERMSKDPNDDTLQPLTEVNDMTGMKFIVDGTAEDVDRLMKQIQSVITTRFKNQLDENEPFKRKDHTRGSETQSGRFQGKRFRVKFKDTTFPLELMFHTQREEIENTYDIGEMDETTGRYTGAAHRLMEIDRAAELAQALFPEIYGSLNWDELTRQKREEVVMALRQEKRVEEPKATEVIASFARKARLRELARNNVFYL